MTSLLLRFEAIESRIASYSCPREVSGRVHSLRLRRCFRTTPPRTPTARLDSAAIRHNEENFGSATVVLASQIPASHSAEEEVSTSLVEQQFSHTPHNADPRFGHKTVPRFGQPRWQRIRASIAPADPLPLEHQSPDEEVLTKEESNVYSALRTGNPHAVMRSLMNLVQLESYGYPSPLLLATPPPIFSEILRCIDPKHFVDPYTAVFSEISSVSTHLLGGEKILGREDYYEFCSAFIGQAGRIMNARRQLWPLNLSDYKYLLKCAKSVGHANAAEQIWKSMITPPKGQQQGDSVVPDAEAFNHFLAVKCWQAKTNPKHRYRLRVIEENYTPRSWLIPPHTLASHRVGTSSGIKAQASQLFRQMVKFGVTGNEETFCLLIIALSREADLDGIAAILRRVWNIDVDSIMTKEESSIPPPTAYSQRSPFFPSNYLLYSIAHAYGSNNDISTALRLLDYVSRHYSITIPLNVWNEILQWTALLAVKKMPVRKKGEEVKETGRETGQLPAEAVSNLWQTMTSEPYNVKPTIQMYNRLMTNLAHRQRFGEMQRRMEDARTVLKKEVRILGRKEAAFVATQERGKDSLVEARARDLIYARFRVWRNRQYVKRWLRMLITRGSKNLSYDDRWSQQNFPNIVRDWVVFLPNPVKYKTSSGHVRFWSGTNQLKRWRSGMLARRAQWQAKMIARWKETDDHDYEEGLREYEEGFKATGPYLHSERPGA
ncbi:uncharacterized protein PAC_14920 [Phialocephala subalpina]|uniref:ATPase expression protein 2, mitochondrial n=1 Tax=Phialocephala subalpina TaxID=576137 RepID=A0A1L7XJ04_9HELO|nr:uncharacterized protein PAC_14920 [Phialocephala subalpina]